MNVGAILLFATESGAAILRFLLGFAALVRKTQRQSLLEVRKQLSERNRKETIPNPSPSHRGIIDPTTPNSSFIDATNLIASSSFVHHPIRSMDRLITPEVHLPTLKNLPFCCCSSCSSSSSQIQPVRRTASVHSDRQSLLTTFPL
ncbi:hypothetical protein R1flu_028278 [Riccia fluitans]|uniref:Uncharacterized protein n=1 Tax=Riccia fluitans TaxID=41844 RepID=A0ABD1XLB3_9MARC